MHGEINFSKYIPRCVSLLHTATTECDTKGGEFESDLAYTRAEKHTEGRLEA